MAKIDEAKRAAASARDRRDIEQLANKVAEVRSIEGDTAWVRQHQAICDAATALARGKVAGAEALDIVQGLKSAFEFALAAKLIGLALEQVPAGERSLVRGLGHELALCIYKDEERVPSVRLQLALETLDRVRAAAGPDGETHRLTGAVYKRRWEVGGDIEDLLSARDAYRQAWSRDRQEDAGYGAINAAFLCDVLAARERERAKRLGVAVEAAVPGAAFEKEARALREDVKKLFGEKAPADYWGLVTLAEACFGLGEYVAAAQLLTAARAVADVPEWQVQSTVRQLAALFAHQRAGRDPAGVEVEADAMRAIGSLAQISLSSAYAITRGKVGLALSGGGFRASLYHLGVLARLAELDVLRHVEAISTVSGGSIVGAHYYLKLKERLEAMRDGNLGRDDYVGIVRALIAEFLSGVRTNIRMQTLSNLGVNLLMLFGWIFGKTVTRSTRLADLYDRYFYRRRGRLAEATGAIRMSELLVQPKDEAVPFNPKFSNWRRENKVPVLQLNATSLNTGHGWQFTARWMGEPPAIVGKEIDCKPRYRRLYYSQAPEESLRDFRLSHAVAASAGVPGLFDPIVLEGLYPERTVRLVDGGVHDNQGIEGLLQEGCTFLLCSDASGQMGEKLLPDSSTLGTLLRVNSVTMDRVREVEYVDLDQRRESRALTGLLFIHLKKDIGAPKLDWIRCQDPSLPEPQKPLPYGVDVDLQTRLADLRTDLDAFTDEEAAALMASGYLMTEQQFKAEAGAAGTWGGFNVNVSREPWPFLEAGFLERLSSKPGASAAREALGRRLSAGAGLFFKVFRVAPWRSAPLMILLLGLVLLASWQFLERLPGTVLVERLTVQDVAVMAALLLLGMAIPVFNWLRPDNMVRKSAAKALLALVGWIVCNAYLLLFNPVYLAAGRLKGFYDVKEPAPPPEVPAQLGDEPSRRPR